MAADATADTTTVEEDRAADQQAQDDFEAGAAAETPKPAGKPGKPDDMQASPALEIKPAIVATKPEPKYVRVTEDQYAAWNAAAAKTASYEGQLSKAFGTIGDITKKLAALQGGGAPRSFTIPKDAFAGMERDFPELAEHTRAALEATLRGLTGTPGAADIDPDTMKRLVTEHATEARTQAEIEALQDEHPDWRKIVGQVDITKQQPDANNAFRKWLATKPADYQTRLNSTNSAAVISRAISRFQSEVKTPAKPTPSLQAQLQAARIRGAVQPRGDGGHAAPANTEDREFEAGFASR